MEVKYLRPEQLKSQGIWHVSEVNTGKRITLPDMSYSVPELLDKYSRGIVLPSVQGTYDNTDDFDSVDVTSLHDLTEVHDTLRDIQYTLRERESFKKSKDAGVKQAEDKQADVDARADDASGKQASKD